MAYIKPCVKRPLKSNNEDRKGINEKKKKSIFSSFWAWYPAVRGGNRF